MRKVTAVAVGTEIKISGYLEGQDIMLTPNFTIKCDPPGAVSEQEIAIIANTMCSSLGAGLFMTNEGAFSGLRKFAINPISFTFLKGLFDVFEIDSQLVVKGEAKVDVTDQPQLIVGEIMAALRTSFVGIDDIVLCDRRDRAGKVISVIRVYAAKPLRETYISRPEAE